MARDAPDWLDQRDITYQEAVMATELPIDTLRLWHRLLRATGADFGMKFRSEWHFSTRELIALAIAASLSKLRYPVNAVVLTDILNFTREHDAPPQPFTIGFAGNPAVVMVDAQTIFDVTVEMMSRVRELANA